MGRNRLIYCQNYVRKKVCHTRLVIQSSDCDKHTRLLWELRLEKIFITLGIWYNQLTMTNELAYSVNYTCKKSYNIGPRKQSFDADKRTSLLCEFRL